jgi:putative membrane protein
MQITSAPATGSLRRIRLSALVTALFVLVGALLSAPAQAADPAAPLNAEDQAFLRGAHQAHLAAVAAARVALRKATQAQTRTLANRWLTDHTRLDNALRPVAREVDVDLPAAPDATQQAVLTRYEQTNGAAFDALWVSTQRQAQASIRRLVEAELTSGQNPDVKALARETSPVIAQHAQLLDGSAPALGAAPGEVNSGNGISAGDRPTIAAALAAAGLVFLLGSAWLWRRRPALANGNNAGSGVKR